jgi:hypothetical protein
MLAFWQCAATKLRAECSAGCFGHAPILGAVAWSCVFKVVYWASLLLVLWLWGDLRYPSAIHWPLNGPPVFVSHFTGYDGYYYLHLSEAGYQADEASCAFYPLWPMLIRWTSRVTGRGSLEVGLVLSNVLSVAGWAVLYSAVRERWGSKAAKWTLIFLVAYPGSLFYQFLYSESLFLLLVVGLWRALWRGENSRVWLLAYFLPLTRAVGVFCILPVFWYAVTTSEPAWLRQFAGWLGKLRKAGCGPVADPPSAPCSGPVLLSHEHGQLAPLSGLGLVLASLCGWCTYLAVMRFSTGNPFEGFSAQRYWGVHSARNLYDVPKFVEAWAAPTQWHQFSGSVLDRLVFLLLVFCLPVMSRLDKRLILWTYVLGVLPAMSGSFTSLTRFASVAFPLFISLAVSLGCAERRWPRYGLLSLFVFLHCVLVWRYVNFRWAG